VTKNIFIVEGLPGVGKAYFCGLLQQEILKIAGNRKILFFEKRDVLHPFHISESDIDNDIWSIDYRDCISIIENKCRTLFSMNSEAEAIYVFD
jgi:hypothetical protein